jgi:hypothetical protein
MSTSSSSPKRVSQRDPARASIYQHEYTSDLGRVIITQVDLRDVVMLAHFAGNIDVMLTDGSELIIRSDIAGYRRFLRELCAFNDQAVPQ